MLGLCSSPPRFVCCRNQQMAWYICARGFTADLHRFDYRCDEMPERKDISTAHMAPRHSKHSGTTSTN
jgi:hypothetical protein